ncbi:MAG: ATP-binding protein [Ignavibacteria bacterium]|nr:ATP-binding protein [Ignavibacteria bacterium]
MDLETRKVCTHKGEIVLTEKLGIEGIGLGLSLVKNIINLIKGEIKIEDNHPKGTKVILRFKPIIFE